MDWNSVMLGYIAFMVTYIAFTVMFASDDHPARALLKCHHGRDRPLLLLHLAVRPLGVAARQLHMLVLINSKLRTLCEHRDYPR